MENNDKDDFENVWSWNSLWGTLMDLLININM